MKLNKVELEDFGGAPFIEHNYPCPVYHDKKAVRIVGHGYFQPSWAAQKDGFKIIKADSFIKRLILKCIFGDDFKIKVRK